MRIGLLRRARWCAWRGLTSVPRFNRHKNPSDVHSGTVRRYVHSGTVRRNFTEAEDKLVVRLRKAGWSLGEIGLHMNRPKQSIANALHRIAVWEEHHAS